MGGTQGHSGLVLKISPPLGFDPWAVQPVLSHYTNYNTWAHGQYHLHNEKFNYNITITCKDEMLRAAWTDGTRWGAKNESTLIQAAKAREETKTLPASCCSSSSPDCRES